MPALFGAPARALIVVATVIAALLSSGVLPPPEASTSVSAPGTTSARAAAASQARITANPGNPAAPKSSRHRVRVNGVLIPVKRERVSGSDRDVAMLTKGTGMAGITVNVPGIRRSTPIVVSPYNFKIAAKRSGTAVTFSVREAHMLMVRARGIPDLFLYITPAETTVPTSSSTNTLYFGPGVHRPGVIRPLSGQTVYLAPGALVYGRIEAKGVHDVRVLGRGILDASTSTSRAGKTMAILFEHSQKLTVQGIGIRNAQFWQTLYLGCEDVAISWTNLMGELINNDGIDLDGVRRVRLSNNFIDSGDDGFGWHALDARANGEMPTSDIAASDNTFWNVRAGNAIRIGSSMETKSWPGISITRSFVIRAVESAFAIDHQDWATLSNVTVDGMYVETRPSSGRLLKVLNKRGSYSNSNGAAAQLGHGGGVGQVSGVTFKSFRSKTSGRLVVEGTNWKHMVNNVRFVDVVVGSTRIVRTSQIAHNKYVGRFSFR